MWESKTGKIVKPLTALVIIMIIASSSIARQSRKSSSSRSSGGSRNSGSSRSSSRSSSGSSSRSSSGSSSGSAARSRSSSSPGASSRTYRRATPPRISTSTSRGRTSTSRSSQSGAATSRAGGLSDRLSRRSSSSSSAPGSAPRSGRIDRRYYSYSEHPYARRSLYHYHRDHYPSSRIFYWISWPDCCRPICYPWGPYYTFGHFWPYYHRRFVFVSIGGYWPDYPYRRYYWYGCHPYRWYGYYPPGYVTAGPTYNYYYYDEEPRGEAIEEAHKKFEQAPPAKPAPESQTDRYFDQAVKAFEAGDYAAAADKFHEAQKLAPDDIVLPFARVQALFAAGQYNEAAAGLREALATAAPDKEGVFYPRGLYSDEKVLPQQIEQLSRAAQLNKLDEAAEHLQIAKQNSSNNQAATTLMNLLHKLRKPADSISDVKQQQDSGSAKAPSQKRQDVDMVALAKAADNWLAVN